MLGPFELERHTSVYAPLSLTAREPSIYVSDDSDFAQQLAKRTVEDPNMLPLPTLNRPLHNGRSLSQDSQTFLSQEEEYPANAPYAQPRLQLLAPRRPLLQHSICVGKLEDVLDHPMLMQKSGLQILIGMMRVAKLVASSRGERLRVGCLL